MKRESERGGSSAGLALLLAIIGIVLIFAIMVPVLGGMGMLRFGHTWNGFPFPVLPMLPLGLMSLIQIGLAVWVGIDANRRGLNGVLWGLLVLFTSVVGLVVYLLVGSSQLTAPRSLGSRSPAAPAAAGARCPHCGGGIRSDFAVCPHCATPLARCGACGKPAQSDWRVCPYCGSALDTEAGTER